MKQPLFISFSVGLILGAGCSAQVTKSQDTTNYSAEAPANLVLSYKHSILPGDVDAVLTNGTDKSLVAFVYDGTCASKMHAHGYADSAVTYSPGLEPGKSRPLATVDNGCKVAITAGIFSDGSEFGSSDELRFIHARRKIAAIELRSILTEAYQKSGNSKLELDILTRIVKAHRDALPPIAGEQQHELLTRKFVLDQLDAMLAAFGEYPPTSDAMRTRQIESIQNITQSWLGVLDRRAYPKTRVPVDVGNLP
jgi:hypothetical protein